MRDRRAALTFGLAIAAAILLADQVSKWWILEVVRLQEKGVIELSPVFDLTFVRNFGVSFGLLRAGSDIERWGLMALSTVIAGVFLWWMRTADRKLTIVALAMVVGGAVGNMIDRMRFGFVVDFLDFSGLFFPWVFNVADSAITVGAALLVLDYLVHGESRARGEARPS
ncbi:MAG: signal peptidase II [Hyphomonadaceae bacterium]